MATTISTPARSTPSDCFAYSTNWWTPARGGPPGFDPAYMLDQSHNVTDPIESLMASAIEVQRAYAQALIVDRRALEAAQEGNDVMLAQRIFKAAFVTDVSPILAEARRLGGGAIDPIAAYRASNYRAHKAEERPAAAGSSSGIVGGRSLHFKNQQVPDPTR